MTVQELHEELKRIEISFGKSYTMPILEILVEEFGHYSLKIWNVLVKEVLANARSFPNVADFRKADIDLKNVRYYQAKENQSKDIRSNWNHPRDDSVDRESVSKIINNFVKQLGSTSADYENNWRENHIKGNYLKNINFDLQAFDTQLEKGYKDYMRSTGFYKEWGY